MDGEKPQHASDESGNWQFRSGDTNDHNTGNQPTQSMMAGQELTPSGVNTDDYRSPAVTQQDVVSDGVAWSASEFIAHQKSLGWYIVLTLVTLLAGLLVFLLTRDKISTGAVVFVAVVLGIAAARKPRTLPYAVDQGGLTVGNKFYDYGQFRSFALVDDGPFSSIVFMPLQRFMPLITVYFEPRDEDKIVTILSNHLPLETHQLDPLDRLMRKIRF